MALSNNATCKNNTIKTSKYPQPDTIFFNSSYKNKNILIKLPYGGYLQVRYLINLKIYITGLSRHYFNRIMFLIRDRPKPVYDRFWCREVSLAASKTSLRPNRPCDLPATPFRPPPHPPPCNLRVTARNNSHKEVADRLQAMCDRELNKWWLRPQTHMCDTLIIVLLGNGW